jgi:hypothetical protein
VWLPGLFGLGPLLSLQQLEVGPGPAEKSSAHVRRQWGEGVGWAALCVQRCAVDHQLNSEVHSNWCKQTTSIAACCE